MNPDKVFFTYYRPLHYGDCIVHAELGTLSTEPKKLEEIHSVCLQSFVRDYISKREFQSFLGMLCISRCASL